MNSEIETLTWAEYLPSYLLEYLLIFHPSAVTNKNAIIKTNNVEYLILVVNNVVDKIKLSGKHTGTFN